MEVSLTGQVSSRIELLRRQYLQLLEPGLLAIPDPEMLKRPDVQRQLYEKMFHSENLMFAPNSRYQLRVLKELVTRIENAISDPEEDEISDDLMNCLAVLMATPAVPAYTAALQKSYVTYTAPIYAEEAYNSLTVTTLESRALLSKSGVTGLRTWEGALHLGAYIASPAGRALLHGKTVLELGAGTGFLSVFCAKHAEALYVLATDGDGGVVDDIRANMYLNGVEDSGRIKSTVLKWGHALIDELLSPSEEERIYELVLGADVTYDVDAIPSLVATLRDLFEKYPKMTALIAATVRNETTFEAFTNACRASEFCSRDVDFTSPPLDQQTGFFHPTTTQIRILRITRSKTLMNTRG